jgi:hypothetical protein
MSVFAAATTFSVLSIRERRASSSRTRRSRSTFSAVTSSIRCCCCSTIPWRFRFSFSSVFGSWVVV